LKNGVFCKVCALFSQEEAGGTKLSHLVKVPLQAYAHLTGVDGYLDSHLLTSYHKACTKKANDFKATMLGRAGSFAHQLQTADSAKHEKIGKH